MMYNKSRPQIYLHLLKLLVPKFSVSSANAHISAYNSNHNPNYFGHINTK